MEITRREAIGAAIVGASAALILKEERVMADKPSKENSEIRPEPHTETPLSFDAKKLRGISERMITSHWENNYGGAVKNLNKVEEEIVRVTKDTPGFLVSGLKERELTYTNSIILHEHYFGNLGGDGKAGGAVHAALSEAYGSFARFEELFRATGASLAGGSGWTVLDFNLHTGTPRIYWSGNHTQALAFGAPLLVMDMYEHAYAIDYGASAKDYLDAFFRNVQWAEVEARLTRAQKADAALRG
jgi:superoxide dismutase, Fe-Mn family